MQYVLSAPHSPCTVDHPPSYRTLPTPHARTEHLDCLRTFPLVSPCFACVTLRPSTVSITHDGGRCRLGSSAPGSATYIAPSDPAAAQHAQAPFHGHDPGRAAPGAAPQSGPTYNSSSSESCTTLVVMEVSNVNMKSVSSNANGCAYCSWRESVSCYRHE